MRARPPSPQLSHADPASASLSEVEAQFWAGKTREVVGVVEKLDLDSIQGHIAARLAILHGMALFQLGDVCSALDRLRSGVAFSSGGPLELQFSAVLSLFSRESQFQSPEESLPGLSQLRQIATALGDAVSLGSLHLEVARLEGIRGHYINARRHLEVARHLLSRSDRAVPKSMVELVDASLEIYAGNLGRATRSAKAGVEQARNAGLCMPLAGSYSNLGLLLLFSGNPAGAKECLNRALALCDGLVQVRLSVVDSLAQVALFEGDLSQSKILLKQCDDSIQSLRIPAQSWNELAVDTTRCAYFEALRDWPQVVAIADAADPELARRQFKAVRTTLLCAKARALARLGKHPLADATLTTAVRTCPRGAVDPLIVLEASKALCFSLRGDASKGTVHYDRALAACRAIGHRYHESWIERDRKDVTRATRETVAVERRDRDLTETALLVNDVATILGAGHSIDLLAHRIAAILQGTSMSPRVDVRSESGCEYRPVPSSVWSLDPNGGFHIKLRGSDRRVSIHVRDAHSIEEITLLKGLADLTQAAVNRIADTDTEDDEQNLWPRSLVQDGDDTIFRSPRMVELLRIAMRLATTNLPILITGETGTGKEVIARLIHQHSQLKRGPFVPFNCSAMPRDLVESQLFGHRRGAFTGAMDSFPGVIRAAERGTLFLDELADLDPATQPKLLRFLESGEVHPVGDIRPQRVSVRVIAATNADLDELVEQGRFRRDLFYRVGVARLVLPPLRERKDEIPALASLFLDRYSRECERTGVRLGDDFLAALLLFDWPGNIRQLANEIRRVVALAADGQRLGAADLAPEIVEVWNARPTAAVGIPEPGVRIRLDQPLALALGELEKRFIEHAMESSGGRVADAAQLLGISRKGLFLKRRRQGLVRL
jgi:DNA-binding NtrC family response regulator/tetratricopeptide (TPR) repeat protein